MPLQNLQSSDVIAGDRPSAGSLIGRATSGIPQFRIHKESGMTASAISSIQRFTASRPCPVCGGHPRLPQGHGVRCHGFLTPDGRYAHCTREEYGGAIQRRSTGAYIHRLDGLCNCGKTHGDTIGRSVPDAPRTVVREESHVIRSADGTAVAVHRRTKFCDGSKDVKWWLPGGRLGLGGTKVVDLPLYGIDELGTPEFVVITEGEPSRDALKSIGIPALGTVTGAGTSPSDAVLRRVLSVPTVLFWPDNDEDGVSHKDKVMAGLRRIGHQDVRVVDWPDAPAKGDAADFVARGGTAADVLAMVAAAQPFEAPTKEQVAASVAGSRLVVTSLADVTSTPIDWIWPKWLARGKVHILGGHAGDGKSTLLAALAAALSTGGALPDGTIAPVARTLFLLAEDALDDTLKPRLDLHGANHNHIFAIQGVKNEQGNDLAFDLADHLPLLEAEIIARQIDVVVIDPLTSFMPGSDRNSEGAVRDLLTPLGYLAERTGVAVVCVMHVGKSNDPGRRVVQKLIGATAFGAIARVVWVVAPVPNSDDDARRVLGVVKSNLAAKPEPLEWSRAEDEPIEWYGLSDYDPEDDFRGAPAAPKEEAAAFVTELLKGGSVAANTVFRRAGDQGISGRTLRRAARDLGVEKFKSPGSRNGGWYWKLPDGQPRDPEPDESDGAQKMANPEIEKVANPSHTELATLAIFSTSSSQDAQNGRDSGKVANFVEFGRLPAIDRDRDERREDGQEGQIPWYGNGHLLPAREGGVV